MNFDVSDFATYGAWLFGVAKELYSSLNFNFGDFTVNGWALLIGFAVFCVVVYLLGRLAE